VDPVGRDDARLLAHGQHLPIGLGQMLEVDGVDGRLLDGAGDAGDAMALQVHDGMVAERLGQLLAQGIVRNELAHGQIGIGRSTSADSTCRIGWIGALPIPMIVAMG
jgi:hypothetical protein